MFQEDGVWYVEVKCGLLAYQIPPLQQELDTARLGNWFQSTGYQPESKNTVSQSLEGYN